MLLLRRTYNDRLCLPALHTKLIPSYYHLYFSIDARLKAILPQFSSLSLSLPLFSLLKPAPTIQDFTARLTLYTTLQIYLIPRHASQRLPNLPLTLIRPQLSKHIVGHRAITRISRPISDILSLTSTSHIDLPSG